MPQGPRYVVLGAGRLAGDVTRILLARPHAQVARVVSAPIVEDQDDGPAATRVTAVERIDRAALVQAGVARADAVVMVGDGLMLREALAARAINVDVLLVIGTSGPDSGTAHALPRCVVYSAVTAQSEAYLDAVTRVAPAARSLLASLRGRRSQFVRRMIRQQLRGRVTRGGAVAAATVVAGAMVLASLEPLSLWQALYITLLKGFSDPDMSTSSAQQLFQICFTVLAVFGSVTAGVYIGDAIQHARAMVVAGVLPRGTAGHVVVVGLNAVGTQLIRQLRRDGAEVVAVNLAPAAHDVDAPVVVGDARTVETLRRAAVHRCRALVVVVSDDDVGLAVAVAGRAARADLPIVWQPGDPEIQDLVEAQLGVTVPPAAPGHAARRVADLVPGHDLSASAPA